MPSPPPSQGKPGEALQVMVQNSELFSLEGNEEPFAESAASSEARSSRSAEDMGWDSVHMDV